MKGYKALRKSMRSIYGNIVYKLDKEYSIEGELKMCENGYVPYYMYRQKSMINNLENIGYAQPNTICLFNIDTMEESCSVLACGAGAISKRIYNLENRIERAANVKNIDDYIKRIDEMIERKNNLFN